MAILFQQQLQKNPNLPRYLTVLWWILTVWVLWQTMRVFIDQPISQPTRQVQVRVQRLPSLASRHLFGRYDRAPSDLPLTQLQLTLVGTVLDPNDANRSHALVLAPGQHTKIYRTGDTLPGGAVIKKIMKEQIIIEYNGQEQRLLLPVPKLPIVDQPHMPPKS